MIDVKSPEMIHREIESLISGGISHIDALLHYAEENNIEIEQLAAIIRRSTILKEKVREEAVALKMVEDNASSKICD